MAYKLACNQELKNYTITPAEVKDLLGTPRSTATSTRATTRQEW